jgi:hypothetical protein
MYQCVFCEHLAAAKHRCCSPEFSPIDRPSFVDPFSSRFRRITAETFIALHFDRVLVVNCRTKAEYDEGHVKWAIRRHPFLDYFDSLSPQEYSPMMPFVYSLTVLGHSRTGGNPKVPVSAPSSLRRSRIAARGRARWRLQPVLGSAPGVLRR